MNALWTGVLTFSAGTAVSFVYLLLSRERLRRRPVEYGLVAGCFFFLGNALFMRSILTQTISSVYPSIPAAALVFFLLSARRFGLHHAKLHVVFLGVFAASGGLVIGELIQVSGSLIDPASFGVGLLITVCYGLGGYFGALGSKEGIGALSASTLLVEFLLFGMASFLFSSTVPGLSTATYGALASGFFIAVGFLLESFLFRGIINTRNERLSKLNLVNVLSNGDAIFVMIASVLLNSYTLLGLAGLALVYVGATLLYTG